MKDINVKYVHVSQLKKEMQDLAEIFRVVDKKGRVLIGENANPKRTEVIYSEEGKAITVDTGLPFRMGK